MVKLTYFNITALGEPIRLILKINNVDFEDERVEFSEWPALKTSGRFPMQQMPVLEMDGEELTQSSAILKYLGNKFGMVGENALENYRLDQVNDIVTDGRLGFRRWFMAPEDKKEEVKAELLKDLCPLVLKQLNEIVNKTEGDYTLGSKLTWADLTLAVWLDIWTRMIEPTLLEPYPVLQKLQDAVYAVPEVKAWVEARPKTMF